MKNKADLPRVSSMLAFKANIYLSRMLKSVTGQSYNIILTHGPFQAAYFFLGDCLNTLGTFLFFSLISKETKD